jgi:aspartate kinase
MKFGGSSLASAAAIRRVASIVQSQLHLKPVVVVSAFGDTTDHLASILKHSAAGESYPAWKLIKELREYHFSVAEDLLGALELEAVDQGLRESFRDLHVRMAEVCDGERTITPEEKDRTLSLGEQLSSLIVAAAFRELGVASCHMDARKLILTDNQFSNATPRYYETCAKIRWAIPIAADKSVVVLGGFIGANEQGQTTTLGRGGSDFTATVVAAAINASEVQIWKDVDGILTADPRRRSDAWLVKNLSYQEAAELAKAGAQVLHPKTIAPAARLRIPVTLRNTFNPQAEGTRIQLNPPAVAAKSIVCKTGVTLLEVSSGSSGVSVAECSQQLNSLPLEVLGMTESVLYLALNNTLHQPEVPFEMGACMETHLRTEQALLTLVGAGIASDESLVNRIRIALADSDAFILPRESSAISLRIAVPERHLTVCLAALHKLLFATPNPAIFAKPSLAPAPKPLHAATPKDRASRIQKALAMLPTSQRRAPATFPQS